MNSLCACAAALALATLTTVASARTAAQPGSPAGSTPPPPPRAATPAFPGAATPAFPGAAPAASPTPVPLAASPDAVEIVNSGSTNGAAYDIVVPRSGDARYRINGRTATAALPRADVDRLFADIHAAGQLDRLTVVPCMKSASFGTVTTVRYRNHESPDLSCGGDSRLEALFLDVQDLAADLHLDPLLRRTPAPPSPSGTP